MTGCPNGCARPYQSDIGLVGRSGDKYTVFVGGNILGNRLNFQLRDLVPMGDVVRLLVPILEAFKNERLPGQGFGDFCRAKGLAELEKLLPPPSASGKPAHAHPVAASAPPETCDGSPAPNRLNGRAAVPEVPAVEVSLPPPGVTSVPGLQAALLDRETFLAGRPGEEREDFTHRYNTDGSVRETIVYFYGDDQRAAGARGDDPLRREAVYQGKADATRLHTTRKLCDTFFVGAFGHERRDRRVDYGAADSVRTVVFYYEGGLRAADAPSGAAVRRQKVFDGSVS
jgi:hypothetical protein